MTNRAQVTILRVRTKKTSRIIIVAWHVFQIFMLEAVIGDSEAGFSFYSYLTFFNTLLAVHIVAVLGMG